MRIEPVDPGARSKRDVHVSVGPGGGRAALTTELLVEMHTRMLRIRLFEEKVKELLKKGELAGTAHLTIGQEATVVGACIALRDDDYMTGTHRSHGHPIAKGADLKPLMAELFGKQTGICKGKGGSMHLADFSVGSLGESGIVASAMPIAVGAGLSAQTRGTDQVVLSFFGDGGANTGAFHESLNLAAVWRLPVVFLCENNLYACSVAMTVSTPIPDIAIRASAYAIPGVVVDGQDVVAVYEAVATAVARGRSGGGPSLIEAKTYRYEDHSNPRPPGKELVGYRTAKEIERWKARDPIELSRQRLLGEGTATAAALERIQAQLSEDVEASVQFSRASPYPPPEALFDDMYAQPGPVRSRAATSP